MNDFSEIAHGRLCVDYMLGTEVGTRFRAAIDTAHADLWSEIETRYRRNLDRLTRHIYITSLCEHEVMNTDGVLSMWRAYGSRVGGAAIVFDPKIIANPVPTAAVHSSQVMYVDQAHFNNRFRHVVEAMERDPGLVSGMSRDEVFEIVHRSLIFTILSCKHMGFKEEREWRLIYLPFQQRDHGAVEETVVSVGGIPQTIYKVPLHEDADGNGHSFDSLIERVIVGPTLYPEIVVDGLNTEMKANGITDPELRLTNSGIPLRQWG